jgi:hypothetical protein
VLVLRDSHRIGSGARGMFYFVAIEAVVAFSVSPHSVSHLGGI